MLPPGVIVHTAAVEDVKATGKLASDDAVNVGVVPNVCAPGLAKVIVWVARGVTAFEAADAGPVPALLVAVTVNV